VLYGSSGWPPSIAWSDDAVRLPTPPVKPAIIIDVHNPATGELAGLHRIFFRRDGTVERNADGRKCKFSLGAIWGNACMLDCKPDPDGRWGVAEGVETAMAARQLSRIPVWAAVFGGNIAAVTPPPWARRITIFADHDAVSREGYRPGLRFAGDALGKWRGRRGIEDVRVLQPEREGADFADLLQELPYA
jgi:putative DNA primase/helicase